MMKTPDRGIDLIKQFEGLELKAYKDIAAIWTIGYGHTPNELSAHGVQLEIKGTRMTPPTRLPHHLCFR